MIDDEIACLLEEAGYRFVPELVRYQVVEGGTAGETDHSQEFIADELGIPLEDLLRWEDGQMEARGLTRVDPDAPAPQ
jgi:hypothetical protein